MLENSFIQIKIIKTTATMAQDHKPNAFSSVGRQVFKNWNVESLLETLLGYFSLYWQNAWPKQGEGEKAGLGSQFESAVSEGRQRTTTCLHSCWSHSIQKQRAREGAGSAGTQLSFLPFVPSGTLVEAAPSFRVDLHPTLNLSVSSATHPQRCVVMVIPSHISWQQG